MNIHDARRAGCRRRKACMGWSWAAAYRRGAYCTASCMACKIVYWSLELCTILHSFRSPTYCIDVRLSKCILLFIYFFAHQHKAAGVKTKQKQRLRRLLIRCSLCCGRRPHSPAAELWTGVETGKLFLWCLG